MALKAQTLSIDVELLAESGSSGYLSYTSDDFDCVALSCDSLG